MRTDDIFQHAMSYAEGADVWQPSHADYYTILPKMYIADKDLDFYTLGVLLRLHLVAYYGYDWQKLYDFGSKEYIDKAINKLETNGYIKREQDKIVII